MIIYTNNYKFNVAIVCILIIITDILWLYTNSKIYNDYVYKIQGSNIQLKFFSGFISYLFALIGLFYFVIPLIKYELNEINKINNYQLLLLSIKYGGLFGIIIYTVLHATNDAIFKNYDLKVALMDTIWGFLLYSFAPFIFLILEKYNQ